ncbi:MAG TPA: glycosyltransferase [Candidatus Krumholzibacteria bacterium]|nr:glycosyltransferase [Candidatus Krumholzibacteria bacterium]
MKRPRVLLIKPVLPFPPEQGTRVVSFAVIESLSAEFDVTVLARVLDDAESRHVQSLRQWCERVVTVFPANRRGRVARIVYRAAYVLRSLLTGRSLKSLYDCPGALVARARELAAEAFDLVIVEYWQLYPLLAVFPPERTVLLTHDIDIQVSGDHARLESRWARVRAFRRRRLEAREERGAYRRARHVWALTGRDADAVRALAGPRTDVSVLPFGLAESAFAKTPGPRGDHEVLFIGAMGAAFNRDAVVHLARDIHPALAGIPGLRVTIVGGALPAEVADFASRPGVTVTGHAPDTGVYLRRATCLLVPLRYGGGLRIRILEAMAAGLPVVCSPVAVAGMGLDDAVLLARFPDEYAAWVGRLSGDPVFRENRSEHARQAVRGRYGPAARGDGIRRLARETGAPGGA